MKCPVCGQTKMMKTQLVYGGPLVEVEQPLYQISYPGEKEYLTPRCIDCYDKVIAKREKKNGNNRTDE